VYGSLNIFVELVGFILLYLLYLFDNNSDCSNIVGSSGVARGGAEGAVFKNASTYLMCKSVKVDQSPPPKKNPGCATG